MSENKHKVEFVPNVPTEVILDFDKPITGTSKYGTWYMWSCQTINNGESVFFATELLTKLLQGLGLGRGDKAIITRVVGVDGKQHFKVNDKSIRDLNLEYSQNTQNGTVQPEPNGEIVGLLNSINEKIDKLLSLNQDVPF